MPNWQRDLKDRKILHTHTLITNFEDGEQAVEKAYFYEGTYYGDSITKITRAGITIWIDYWKGRCPLCERHGHPINTTCEDCDCHENAVNPKGSKKY